MNNERNEMPEFNGHHSNVTRDGRVTNGTPLSYEQIPFDTKGDLRMTPRLDSSTMPRRKCNGEPRGSAFNSSPMHGWGLNDYPLAMVYSPYQSWRELYTLDVALAKGTLFSELDLPLEAINCRRGC